VRNEIHENPQWRLAKGIGDEFVFVRPRMVRVIEAGQACLAAKYFVA